jgi:hypothetical protein
VQVLKKSLIPIVIVIILLALYFTRWEKEVTIKPNAAVQSIYKTDRWTGQGWVVTYRGNTILEEPTLDNYAVSVYAETVKHRPDVIDEREKLTKKAHDFANAYNPKIEQRKGFAIFLPVQTREDILNYQLSNVDNIINSLALNTAKTDLSNKAWVKRKYYSWAWDGLFALASLWLLVSILLKMKKPGVA